MNRIAAKKMATALLSATLIFTGSLAVWTGSAVATQPRGEIAYKGPLRYPTPKSAGLGGGWAVQTAQAANGNRTSKSCRVATKCSALIWTDRSEDGVFTTLAYRAKKSEIKLLVNSIKRGARDNHLRVITTRKGKTITYTVVQKNSGATITSAFSVYNQTRVGQLTVGLPKTASKKAKKNSSVAKVRALAEYMANPANGKVSRVVIKPN